MNDGREGLNLAAILPRQFDGPSVHEIMAAVPADGWNVDETVMRIGDEGL